MITFLVAAADATSGSRRKADYLCDGTADEVQINAAIAALPAGGGCVQLSEGTFTVTTEIGDQGKSRVALCGAGRGTVIKLADNANAGGTVYVIHLHTVAHWRLADFKVDGNKANNATANSSHAIELYLADDCLLDGLEVVDAAWVGIHVRAGARNVITSCKVDNPIDTCIDIDYAASQENIVANCWIGNNDTDHGVAVSAGADRTLIIGNTFFNPSATCIEVQGTVGNIIYGTKIIGNTIDGNDTTPGSRSAHGIDIANALYCFDTIVEGNTIYNCGSGIYCTGDTGQLTGNMIRDCDTGILLVGGTWGVLGNQATTINGRGIEVRGTANNAVLQGNTVVACTTHGIEIETDNCVLTGNVSTGNTNQGLNIEATADATMVSHNNFAGNTGVNVADGGTNTQLHRNVGWVTESSGTGTIDNGTTSEVIAHGLSVTPTVDDISITLAEDPTNSPGAIWIDTIGAANFTINCENDPGASNLDFGWRAVVL